MKPRIVVIVSIDTEEDNWVPTRHGIRLDNIRKLPSLQAGLSRAGLRPTYFTTWQVLQHPWAAEIIRSLSDDAEIGAHLHPWNTPPTPEPLQPSNTMVKNLPADLQLAKLKSLTSALAETLGRAPTSFRAGRFGIGPGTLAALVANGYRVDSSVMPFVSWEETDNGPNFVGAPLNAYRLAAGGDVRTPVPSGPLIEVPLSSAFNRGPFPLWSAVQRILTRGPLRRLHASGLASSLGIGRRILISPESTPVADMLLVARALVEQGVRHLQVFFHSPSFTPGLTPFVFTAAQARSLVPSIERFLEGIARFSSPVFMTIGEAAQALVEQPGAAVDAHSELQPAFTPVRIRPPVVEDGVREAGGNWIWMLGGALDRALCLGDTTGVQLASLSRRFATVVSVDRRGEQSQALASVLARHDIGNVSHVLGWMPSLPVGAAEFDCVVLPGLFDRWPAVTSRSAGMAELQIALEEARRVLKPGGALFLSLPNPLRRGVLSIDPLGLPGRLARSLVRRVGLAGSGDSELGERWSPSPALTETLVRRSGFSRIRLFYAEPSHEDPLCIVPRSRHATLAYERARSLEGGGTLRRGMAGAGLHGLLYGSVMCFATA